MHAHAQTNRQCKRVLSPFITVLAPYPGYRAGTVPSVNTVLVIGTEYGSLDIIHSTPTDEGVGERVTVCVQST